MSRGAFSLQCRCKAPRCPPSRRVRRWAGEESNLRPTDWVANHVRVRSAAPCRTRAPVVTWLMSVRDRFGLRVGLGAALEGRARRSEAIHELGMARMAATKGTAHASLERSWTKSRARG